MAATDLCIDFTIFPDDLTMPPQFTIGGFTFTNRDPAILPFVNITGGERGLQFGDGGLEVTLPMATSEVRLRVGIFATPFDIVATSAGGAVVAQQTVTGPNQYLDVSMAGPGIATLTFRGGGNEGVVERVCICADLQPCRT